MLGVEIRKVLHPVARKKKVLYLCDPCKEKLMKDWGVKEDKKGEGGKDSADDDTESEDEGASRTTTETPKESGTVRYDPEPNTQQVTSGDEHSYAGERKQSLNEVRKERPTENNEKKNENEIQIAESKNKSDETVTNTDDKENYKFKKTMKTQVVKLNLLKQA